MISKREWTGFAIVAIVLLLLVGLPYAYAWRAGGEDFVFTGFLINPQDANTYLAKMRQGFEGSWTFTLPYTAEPGEGRYLNLFYLFLGHVSRILEWPLLLTFHITRLVSAVALLFSLFYLCARVFPEKRPRWLAFCLLVFGSGIGWLGALFGLFTADLWVAEMYPFLAAYTNPHFPTGLAIQCWLLLPRAEEKLNWRRAVILVLAALIEALVSPFGVVVVLVVLGGKVAWRFFRQQDWKALFTRAVVIGLVTGPILLYYQIASMRHPALSVWSVQNLTLSPPWWDLLISLSPALLLALWGGVLALRNDQRTVQMPAVWLFAALVLVYVPFSLQRRFLQGLYVPVALLAAFLLNHLARTRPAFKFRLAVGALFVLFIPTNLLVLVTAAFGAQAHDPSIYLTAGESAALAWIEDELPPDSLVLASPEIGLFLPVYTHSRVLYGHPYETVNAEAQEAFVLSYFSGELDDLELRQFWQAHQVDYLFYGPREAALGRIPDAHLRPLVETQGVVVYELRP